jgi:hypothetical protein
MCTPSKEKNCPHDIRMPPVDADLNFPKSLHTREESDLPTAASAIASTSGCGCDFPHVTLQNEQWPIFEDVEKDAERDAPTIATIERH